MKKFEKPEMIIAKFDSESVVVTASSAKSVAEDRVGNSYKTIGGSDNY